MIGRSNLDGGWQIEHDSVLEFWPSFAPGCLDSFADLESKVGFSLGEGFRTVLITEDRASLGGTFFS